jgi:hypothetical protein
MKRYLKFSVMIVVFCLLLSCGGKSVNPTPVNPPVNGGGNNNPVPSPYIVKTVGVSGVAVLTKSVNGKMVATNVEISDGMGTVIQLNNEGEDVSLEITGVEAPSIKIDGYAVASFPAKYLQRMVTTVIAEDSLKAPTIKIKGFKSTSYNQLNLVLVDDKTFGAQTIGFKNVKNTADINGSIIKESISIKMKILKATINGVVQ